MSEKTSSSIINTISGYVTSKKMIYLVGAIVLSVGIYFYMNKKSKAEEIKTEAPNQEQEQQQNGEPEIIFSQELVQNLYQNNSNPIKYLQLLQQQGQIPNGPLPKIVLDYNINAENNQVNNLPQVQETKKLEKIEENEESEISEKIVYNEPQTANSISGNQYQKIEDDNEDDFVNQKLTKEEIENINNRVMKNSN